MEFLEYETDFQFLNQTKNNLKRDCFSFVMRTTLPERTVLDTSNSFMIPERNIARVSRVWHNEPNVYVRQ